MRKFQVAFTIPEAKLGQVLVLMDDGGFAPDSVKLIIDSLTELSKEAKRVVKRRPKRKRAAFGALAKWLRDQIGSRDREEFKALDLITLAAAHGFSESGIRGRLRHFEKLGQLEETRRGVYRAVEGFPNG